MPPAPTDAPVSRRGFLNLSMIGGGLLAGAGALSACGGPGGSTATGSSSTGKATKITVGTTITSSSMNPLDDQYSTVQFAAYDALVRKWATDEEPEPRLAESWTQTDPTTWTFTLREGITFHDGSRITAADVAFTYALLMKQKYGNYSTMAGISSIEALEDGTVEVRTDGPDPLLMSRLASLFIIPQAHWEKVGGEEGFIADPVGSGPFTIGEHAADTGVTFTAYPDFWDGPPATETVELKYFTDANALALALQSGQVDAAHSLSPAQYLTLKDDTDLDVQTGFAGGQNMMQLKTTDGPFADLRVRQAAIAAVDAQALISGLSNGLGELEDGQLPLPVINGYTTEITRPAYDLDEAKRLLVQAGAQGAEITITGMSLYQNLLEALGEQLTAAGFKPTIQALELSEWVQQFINGFDGDIFYRGLSYTGVFDADRPFSMISYGEKPAVVDETWDELFAATRTEADPDVRLEKLVACSQYLYDQAYVLWTYASPGVNAASSALSGISFDQGLVVPFETMEKSV